MARTRRKPRLSKDQKRLLTYPPTPGTWECRKARKHLYTDEKVICRCVNNANEPECWLCRAAKPKKPKLLWPDYLKACAIAGIEPGEKWKEGDSGTVLAEVLSQGA